MENSIVNPPSKHSSLPDITDKSSTVNIIAAGIGTALIFLAKDIPDSSFIKSWLINSAPSVSVFSIWLWKILNRLYVKTDRYIEEKTAEWSFLINTNKALKDPQLDEAGKEKLRQERLKLKLEKATASGRKLRILRKRNE